MGHVHLFGNNLIKQMVFYRDILGFREGGMGENIGMAEVALDRPHVIAFNTWQGESAQPAPENSLGVKYFSIILPTNEHWMMSWAGLRSKIYFMIEPIKGFISRILPG